MVAQQLRARDINDPEVLQAMATVPRHLFTPPALQAQAYEDHALHLGPQQSISQPYIVALMTQWSQATRARRVLEIGTGSGYQAAVLSLLAQEVYSIERDQHLATLAREKLKELSYPNVQVWAGDGLLGWPDAAPFDAILITAAAKELPQVLLRQLAPHGRMVIPMRLDDGEQMLRLVQSEPEGLSCRDILKVRFVPLDDH